MATRFEHLRGERFNGLSVETLQALHAAGFEEATPVQAAVVPLFCGHKDVAVDAATGSGKTLAFVLPIIERLRKLDTPPKRNEVVAMVISPVRELSKQIYDVAVPFIASVPGYSVRLLIGGTNVQSEEATLKQSGANVVIGTPGRILDVMRRTNCSLKFKSRFEVLVLDEADRLLELGFKRELDEIMKALPTQRRTGLFSATQTEHNFRCYLEVTSVLQEAVEQLVRAGLRNPHRVNVTVTSSATGAHLAQKTPATLENGYMLLESDAKLTQLVAHLAQHHPQKAIVYFLTRASVDFFAASLPRLPGCEKLNIVALHGNMKPEQRRAALEAFQLHKHGVLLCTDVGARGLDFPDISWIVQFDLPQDPDNFVHRVGRTARMGRSGKAMAMLLPHEAVYVHLLANRDIPLTQRPVINDADDMVPHIKRLMETDRDVMEKGAKAFVSFIKGYKEHHCSHVFDLAKLDINLLARLFGLLRLPSMKEV